LLGCDYCNSIKGVGPKRAIELIRTHGSIEKIIENLDSKKFSVPEDWPYEYARRLFVKPEIAEPADVEVCLKSFLPAPDAFKSNTKNLIVGTSI
jgi:flap endonuclease-1